MSVANGLEYGWLDANLRHIFARMISVVDTPCGFVFLQVCRCNLTLCCVILRTSIEGNFLVCRF